MSLPEASRAPHGTMFANQDREKRFALPHGGGDAMSSITPTAEEDTTSDDVLTKSHAPPTVSQIHPIRKSIGNISGGIYFNLNFLAIFFL